MDPYVGATSQYYKSYNIYVLCYNFKITVLPLSKYQKYTRNLYLKILVDNIISKVINMLTYILY
jgi:hypothetical protein